MRILVTGKSGQVARAVGERAAEHGVTTIFIGRPEFDLSEPKKNLDILVAAKPDVILSAAAYTMVDQAETDAENAQAINVGGPAYLAQLSAGLAIPLIHLSTDYVFDGTKPLPYVEEDNTNPLNVYGSTKLNGECAVAAVTSNYAILRTAWLYSPFGANFLKTMLRLGAKHPQLRVVNDQLGNPTSALDLAEAIIQIAHNLLSRPNDQSLRGTFHITGNGEASWADFADAIFATSMRLGGPNATVARIGSAQYPTPAKRPANSRLSNDKLLKTHGIALPDWRISTHATVERLLREANGP